MKELSLNILDIVQNSVKAGATRIERCLEETDERFSFWVRDNGCGMSEELLAPDWSRRKVSVINDIDKLLYARSSWQGRLYEG